MPGGNFALLDLFPAATRNAPALPGVPSAFTHLRADVDGPGIRRLLAEAAWYRRHHKEGKTGAVTVLQRASSVLRLNPRFHKLFLDGDNLPGPEGETPVVEAAPKPAQEAIEDVVQRARKRILRYPAKRGMFRYAAAPAAAMRLSKRRAWNLRVILMWPADSPFARNVHHPCQKWIIMFKSGPSSLVILAVTMHSVLAEPIVVNSQFRSFPNILPGKVFKLEKTMDPVTRQLSLTSTDGFIKSGDELVSLENAEREVHRQKWGRLSPVLIDRKSKSKSNQDKASKEAKTKVVVGLKPPRGPDALSREGRTKDALRTEALALLSVKPVHSMAWVLSAYGIAPGVTIDDFSSIVDLTEDQMERLAKDENIAHVSEYSVPEVTTLSPIFLAPSLFGQTGYDDIVTLARSAYSHSQDPLPAGLANGIHAATFEKGLLQSYLSCMNITPVQWDPQWEGLDLFHQQHSLATFTCLKNAAPGASLYHRSTLSYDNAGTASYITNNGLSSISMSANLGAFDPIHLEARAIDDWAYRYPYPVILTTTDNWGWWLPSGMSGPYNQINVGNVQDYQFQHFKVDVISCSGGATQTVNPPPIYGSCIDGGTDRKTCAGDRETPYMVSPGHSPQSLHTNPPTPCSVTGPFMLNACLNPAEPQKWGTSLSAPVLNGIAAGIQAQRPSLMFQPEAVRAVLLATAQNVIDGDWAQGIDGKDGAGVVHGADAQAFATAMVYASPNGTAQQKGYWWGELGASDFSGSKSFNINIPASIPAGQHLRLVLTWDSSPDADNNTNALSDLDPWFFGNSGSHYSSSWDANIEIIDIPNTSITANATYTAQISAYFWRGGSGWKGKNGTLNTKFPASLVWTFVADHAR